MVFWPAAISAAACLAKAATKALTSSARLVARTPVESPALGLLVIPDAERLSWVGMAYVSAQIGDHSRDANQTTF